MRCRNVVDHGVVVHCGTTRCGRCTRLRFSDQTIDTPLRSEIVHYRSVTLVSGGKKRSETTLRYLVDASSLLYQVLHNRQVAISGCHHERSKAIVVSLVLVSTSLH